MFDNGEPPFPGYDPFGRATTDRSFDFDDQVKRAKGDTVFDRIGEKLVERYQGDPNKLKGILNNLGEAIKKGRKSRQTPSELLMNAGLGNLIGEISTAQGQLFNEQLDRRPINRIKGVRFYDKSGAPESLEKILNAMRIHSGQ